ncbi:MAG: hypothetical protein IPM69_03185 [Ignavibacteria bacterium]|nr:hypothetical protein [Ignavibacteria bacterium]
MNQMKYIYWTFTLAFLLIIYLWSADYVKLYSKGSYTFVFEADKDDAYENLLFVKNVMGERELHILIERFLSPNNPDHLTKDVAIRYIRENNKIEFLSNLKSVKKFYESINPDTLFTVYVESNRIRSWSLRNAAVISDLNETILELELIKR